MIQKEQNMKIQLFINVRGGGGGSLTQYKDSWCEIQVFWKKEPTKIARTVTIS